MNDKKRGSISLIAVALIFVTAILGLYAVNGLEKAESYEDNSNHEFIDKAISDNEIVKKFNEIDGILLSFFNDVRHDLGSLLFILEITN